MRKLSTTWVLQQFALMGADAGALAAERIWLLTCADYAAKWLNPDWVLNPPPEAFVSTDEPQYQDSIYDVYNQSYMDDMRNFI